MTPCLQPHPRTRAREFVLSSGKTYCSCFRLTLVPSSALHGIHLTVTSSAQAVEMGRYVYGTYEWQPAVLGSEKAFQSCNQS